MPAGLPPNVTHSSVYRISGRQSSWEAYDKELRRFGIFVKARNSLVFQVCLRPWCLSRHLMVSEEQYLSRPVTPWCVRPQVCHLRVRAAVKPAMGLACVQWLLTMVFGRGALRA